MSSCRSSILSNSMSSYCSGVFCVWASIGVLESRNTRKEGPKKTQNYQLLKWVQRPDAIQPHDGRVAEDLGADHLIAKGQDRQARHGRAANDLGNRPCAGESEGQGDEPPSSLASMPLREGSEQRTRERVVALLAAGWDGLWSDFWIRHVSSSRKNVTVASNPDRSFFGLPQDQQLTWHRSIWAPNFWMHQTP